MITTFDIHDPKICECCGESEKWQVAIQHDSPYCEACSKTSSCKNLQCLQELDEERYLWERGYYCINCEEAKRIAEFYDIACETLEKMCEQYGWRLKLESVADTGSRYYLMSKESGDNTHEYKVRISDHATVYCSENISISMNPGGDDHDWAFLEAKLTNEEKG